MSVSPSAQVRMSLAQVNAQTREEFVATFGDIFERSAWVAERAWDARPFASREALFDALAFVLGRAESTEKLALIRAHPDLADKESRENELTDFSGKEQAGAGLNAVTAQEARRLQELNSGYRERFGFPCIIAVKGLDKKRILEIFETRLGGTRDAEFAENLKQIRRIARFRLAELIDPD